MSLFFTSFTIKTLQLFIFLSKVHNTSSPNYAFVRSRVSVSPLSNCCILTSYFSGIYFIFIELFTFMKLFDFKERSLEGLEILSYLEYDIFLGLFAVIFEFFSCDIDNWDKICFALFSDLSDFRLYFSTSLVVNVSSRSSSKIYSSALLFTFLLLKLRSNKLVLSSSIWQN